MSNQPSPSARDDAVAWFTRLQDSPTAADWRGFTAWLERNPAHRTAYDSVEMLWDDLGAAAELREKAPGATGRSPSRSSRALPWLAGLAAAAAVTVLVWTVLRPTVEPDPVEFAATANATEAVSLRDGSSVVLNRGTRVTVALGERDRVVALADGEAAFDVAADPARPFLVQSGGRTISVVGTAFDVLSHAGRLIVTVQRGKVTVLGPDGAEEASLLRGDQLVYAGDTHVPSVRTVDPDDALAWQTGSLVFRDMALPDALASIGLYTSRPIESDPSLAALRVTAVLAIDTEAAMLSRLEQFLPVRIRHEAARYVVEPRA